MSVQLPHFQVPKEFVDAIEILHKSCDGIEPDKAWSGLQKHCHEVKKNTIRVVHETLKKIGELNQVTEATKYLDTLCVAYKILYEKDHVSVGARPKTAHTETLKPTKKFADRCQDVKELPGPQLRKEIQSLAQMFFANFESFSKTVELQERYQFKFMPKRPTDELGKIRSKGPSEEYMPLCTAEGDFSLLGNSGEIETGSTMEGDFSLLGNSGEIEAGCTTEGDFFLSGGKDPRTRVSLIAQGDSDDPERSHTPATARRPHKM